MDLIDTIKKALEPLEAEFIDLEDESHLHEGHAGAKAGAHFSLTIISKQFNGLNRPSRHRLVYQALGSLMQTHIHALALKTLAPNEV